MPAASCKSGFWPAVGNPCIADARASSSSRSPGPRGARDITREVIWVRYDSNVQRQAGREANASPASR